MRRALAAALFLCLPAAAAPGESPGDVALRLDQERYPALDPAEMMKRLDAAAEAARKRLEGREGAQARIEGLLHHLMQERGYEAAQPSADVQAASLSRVLLRGRRGHPEILAVAYAELARRLGMKVSLTYLPDRLLVTLEDGDRRLHVDVAEGTVKLTDPSYRKMLRLPEQGPWLDPVTVPAGLEAFLRRRRAEAELAAGRREAALADAEKAAALDPPRLEAWLTLARVRWALGDAPGARQALAPAKALPAAALLEGGILETEGDAEAALAAYGRAASEGLPALSRQASLARGRLRALLGRHDQARRDFAEALEDAPGLPGGRLAAEEEALRERLAALDRRRAAAPAAADLRIEVPGLLARLREADPAAREGARKRLEELGPRAAPLVQEALVRGEPEERLGGLMYATAHPDPALLDGVLAAVGDADLRLRLAALGAVGALAESEGMRARALDRIRALPSTDPDPEVRRRAATALARHGDAAAMPFFRAALADPDAENRRQAALALGRLGDRESAPRLREALADAHPRVRARAAQALALLGDEGAIPALVHALRDEDRDVRQEVHAALRKVTREEMGPDPAKWEDWLRGREETAAP